MRIFRPVVLGLNNMTTFPAVIAGLQIETNRQQMGDTTVLYLLIPGWGTLATLRE